MGSLNLAFVVASLTVLVATTVVAQSDQEIYAEADRIFENAEEAVIENLANFIAANEKPFATARHGMAELISQLNIDGRSQLATSLQRRLNGLEETIQRKASLKVPVFIAPKPETQKVVSLLPLVDLTRDVMRGSWKRVGDEIETNGKGLDQLLFRQEPPAEYDFKCEFTCLGNPDCIALDCYAHGSRFACDFGGWGNDVIGFNLVDGRIAKDTTSSVKARPVLALGKRHTAIVKVRRNEVSAWLDGQMRVALPTNYANLTYREDIVIPQKMLGVHSFGVPVRFHSAIVEDMTATR